MLFPVSALWKSFSPLGTLHWLSPGLLAASHQAVSEELDFWEPKPRLFLKNAFLAQSSSRKVLSWISLKELPRCSGTKTALPTGAGVAVLGGHTSHGQVPGSEPWDSHRNEPRRNGWEPSRCPVSTWGSAAATRFCRSTGRQGHLTQSLILPPFRNQHYLFNHFPKLFCFCLFGFDLFLFLFSPPSCSFLGSRPVFLH